MLIMLDNISCSYCCFLLHSALNKFYRILSSPVENKRDIQ